MSQPPAAALDFLSLLWSLNHDLQAFSKRMESQLGVTGPQRLALRMIGREPALPAGKLAQLMRLHPSTVSGVLVRLQKKRLVKRHRDAEDGRRVLLTLTAAGQKINRSTQGTVEGAVRQLLRDSDAVELGAMRTLLTRLRANLGRSALETER